MGALQNPSINSMQYWHSQVEIMREFAQKRPRYLRAIILSEFDLENYDDLTLSNSGSGNGKVLINSVEIPLGSSGSYLRNIPLTLTAVPDVGSRFVRWEGLHSSTERTIEVSLNSSSNITAVFEPNDNNQIPEQITQSTILTLSGSPYYAAGDVTVKSNATLTIGAGVEILMPEKGSIYIEGNLIVNGTGASPVVIKPNLNSEMKEWGGLCFNGATTLSTLSHLRLEAATEGADHTKYMGAISGFNSNLSLDHITILDAPFPIFIQYGSVTLRNSTLHSEKHAT